MTSRPTLLLGAGRMGGALISGWLSVGALAPRDLLIVDPNPGQEAIAAGRDGALLNPEPERWREAEAVVLAVKPQGWREAATVLAERLAPDAAVLSVAAGVKLAALKEAFQRPAARVMPNTAVAVAKGSAAVFASDERALAAARRLFAPVATLVELTDEGLMDAATAVSGSGPAYLYAFVEALAAAGATAGLPAEAAAAMARSTVIGAAALLASGDVSPGDLRRQVTSPGGTTQAALDVLQPALATLLRDAVRAAADRSRTLGA